MILIPLILERVWSDNLKNVSSYNLFLTFFLSLADLSTIIYPTCLEDKQSGPKTKAIFPLGGGGSWVAQEDLVKLVQRMIGQVSYFILSGLHLKL